VGIGSVGAVTGEGSIGAIVGSATGEGSIGAGVVSISGVGGDGEGGVGEIDMKDMDVMLASWRMRCSSFSASHKSTQRFGLGASSGVPRLSLLERDSFLFRLLDRTCTKLLKSFATVVSSAIAANKHSKMSFMFTISSVGCNSRECKFRMEYEWKMMMRSTEKYLVEIVRTVWKGSE
jgi:hypothetical protein